LRGWIWTGSDERVASKLKETKREREREEEEEQKNRLLSFNIELN
jgi:hypothetical protein